MESIVTHEEVVGIWVGSPNSEKLHQVVKLTMDISAHGYRAFLNCTLADSRNLGGRNCIPPAAHLTRPGGPLVPG